jgi:MYXO-CTERM domain-containing protein
MLAIVEKVVARDLYKDGMSLIASAALADHRGRVGLGFDAGPADAGDATPIERAGCDCDASGRGASIAFWLVLLGAGLARTRRRSVRSV